MIVDLGVCSRYEMRERMFPYFAFCSLVITMIPETCIFPWFSILFKKDVLNWNSSSYPFHMQHLFMFIFQPILYLLLCWILQDSGLGAGVGHRSVSQLEALCPEFHRTQCYLDSDPPCRFRWANLPHVQKNQWDLEVYEFRWSCVQMLVGQCIEFFRETSLIHTTGTWNWAHDSPENHRCHMP